MTWIDLGCSGWIFNKKDGEVDGDDGDDGDDGSDGSD